MVADSLSKDHLPHTSIVLYKDGILAKAFTSEPDGTFVLQKLSSGKYTIKFRAIGYLEKLISFTLNEQKLNMNLGIVRLQPETRQLQAVNVQAVRPIVKQEAD